MNKDKAMKDDYLWDGSGEPDVEVQNLEKALGRFRHNAPAPDFGAIAGVREERWRFRIFGFGRMQLWGAVAAALVIAAAGFYFASSRTAGVNEGTSWQVVRIAGTPRVGWHVLREKSGAGKLGVGQTLVTDAASRASITLDETGTVEVDGGSRVRLVANGPGRKRLSLERGTIHATIWAPPGEFVVDTPSAVAVDLGCVYTLHVDDSGAGLLRTTMGWVGFKLNGHESFIPAGAVCATRPKIGPGTPYLEDASVAFRVALDKFDFGGVTASERKALVKVILSEARKSDELTVWHLLAQVSKEDRPLVYERLVALAPPPKGVTREGVLILDRPMLDLWWNSLGFGDVFLWRTYEREWGSASKD
jgi:hypothetical protein